MDDLKTCSACGEAKPRDLRHFAAHDRTRDGLRGKCRRCQSEAVLARYAAKVGPAYSPRGATGCGRRSVYSAPDRERGKAERRAENRLDVVVVRRRHRKRLSKLLLSMMRSRRSLSWLGCSPADFRAHIEAQFRPGMTWENRGVVWEIDHIKPVCAFDLADPADRLLVNHFTNLRPVWPEENREKGSTFQEAA